MAKLLIILPILTVCILLDVIGQNTLLADCPLASKMTSCSPKCISDSDCSIGRKCCPNICNTKSCSESNSKNSNSGYKSGSSSATGTYCNNVKCNSYEKCELDKSTKRMKCVRA